MNLIKFLLIDLTLILVGFPLLFIFQRRKGKASFLQSFNNNGFLDQTPIELPTQQQLLALEKQAKLEGSGIESECLIGLWKFVSVWKPASDNEDLIASSLLRFFSATLELKEDDSKNFSISNSIQFGLFSIRFSGGGYLKGNQPLLIFFFKHIEFKAGSRILFTRSLDIPEEKNRPFFSLIAKAKNCNWLSARGRGGGLAVWLKNENS